MHGWCRRSMQSRCCNIICIAICVHSSDNNVCYRCAVSMDYTIATNKHLNRIIFDVYKPEYESLNYDHLMEIVEQTNFNLTEEECDDITTTTVDQSNSSEWLRQRVGRITASKLKSVCHTSLNKPSLSVIKGICYPAKFNSKATEWGLKHESDAIASYKRINSLKHENLDIVSVGLCLQSSTPQLCATPDALVRCNCCRIGCVEVKCLYRLKNMDLASFVELKTSCFKKVNDCIQLDKSHAYYYQIQCQMKMTETNYCDFIVWSPKEMYIERVDLDEEFWNEKSLIALEFHKQVIMPELLGRYFTRDNRNTQSWCICETFDDVAKMMPAM